MPLMPNTIISAAAAGGFTQSYVGYNTIGATFDNTGSSIQYAKTITIATPGMLNTLDFYCRGNGSNVGAVNGIIWNDNAGTPNKVICTNQSEDDSVFMDTTATWVSVPMAMWLPAATYWIGFAGVSNVSGDFQLAYDSGSDKSSSTGGSWAEDTGQLGGGWSNTGRSYSIRGSILR